MMSLTSRNRVWTALTGGILERPPIGEIFIDNAWLKMSGLQSLGEAIQYLRADLVVLPVVPLPQHTATNWQEWATRDLFLFGALQGPLTFFSERLGWHTLSRLIIKQPLEVNNLIRQYLDEAISKALAAHYTGCEGIVILDDLAGDKGLLFNPKFLQDIYFPLLQQALERISCNKVPVIFHSDGNILSLVPMLQEAGFWGIQGLQPSVGLSPAFFSEQTMRDWVYWGNFEFEGQGRLKNISEAEHDTTILLNDWRDFPGYIFGSSGGLYKGLSLPEIKAAYDTAIHWRR